jgi:hypothetical protein
MTRQRLPISLDALRQEALEAAEAEVFCDHYSDDLTPHQIQQMVDEYAEAIFKEATCSFLVQIQPLTDAIN